jgi:hypothetical protein
MLGGNPQIVHRRVGEGSPKNEAAEAVAPRLCGCNCRVAGADAVPGVPVWLLVDAVVVRPPVEGIAAAGSALARHVWRLVRCSGGAQLCCGLR